MDDIVPELYKKIKSEFDGLISSDDDIQSVFEGEQIKIPDVYVIAKRIGSYASLCLRDNFNEKTLPEGILYWNIMERTILPLMKEVHKIINQIGDIAIMQLYKSAGIGIKPQWTEFESERITAMMNMLSHLSEVDIGGNN